MLTSHPTANLTVTVNVPQGTDVSVDKTSLTFTAGNWDDEQTVTVSAAGDEDAVVDDAVTLTHTVSSTGDYASETAADVVVTITETDTPTLSMSGVRADEDVGDMTFTVTLSVASSNEVTVAYATSNGTGAGAATAGEDYTLTNGTLTLPANSTASRTIAVPITDDAVDEADEETFTVTLSNASNATLAGGQPTLAATGTITDDDERGVTVTPTALTVDEGGDETYTVVLDSEPTADVAVTMTTDLAGTDVSVDETSLTFTADDWDDEQTVTVSAAEDNDAVVDATVTLTHSVSSTGDYNGETAADAVVTIVEDDTPTLSIANRSATESAGTMVFTVTLSVASSQTVTVAYATSNGTGAGAATAGEDYTEANGTLTFSANSTASQTVRVPITNDTVDEADEETFTVTLSNASNATLADGQATLEATGTITDDDARGVTVTPTALSVGEGDSEEYTVVLTSQPTADVTVTVNVPQGTDVSVDETSLTFTADNWDDEQTVTVRAAEDNDAVVDATVTLTHSVSSTGDYNGETAADVAVTIAETDTPTLSMSGVRADEDIGEMVFEVTLSLASSNQVRVQYRTSEGTATAGSDYTEKTGTLTFPANSTVSQTVRVSIANDDVDEPDEETFTVTLSSASNATLAGAQATLAATGTITDDDARGVTVTPTALTVDEGGDETYTVVLDSEPTADVTVTVTTDLADTDLSLDKTSLTFTADNWSTAQTVTVTAAGDEDAVVDETVTLTHSVSSTGDYNGETAADLAVTIVEDDTPTLSIANRSATESAGTMVFTVTLSVASSQTVTVAYATSNETGAEAATAGEDYTEANGTLTFPANSTTPKTIAVPITDDAVDEEEEETFTLTLSNASNATLAGAQATLAATGTITDDDARGVTVTPTALTVDEGGDETYTVALDSEPTADVTVTVTVPTGTDVSVDKTSLTFTSSTWNTAQTVTVSAVEDADAATDAAVTITHTVGSTGDYNGETAADVAVTIAETGTPAPSLTLAFEAAAHNDVDASGDVTLSDVLTYTATATNSGNVPLAEVTVSDLLVNAGGVECASLDLGGECELTGDYTVTQADVDAGEVTNTAAAVASGVSEQTASRTTEVAQEKALTLAKTATTGSFGSVGDRIAYSYEATNSGTVTLTGALTIADDRIPASGITCPAVPAAGLGPGASVTCAGSYTVVQADVDASQVTNKATAMLDGMQSNEATATVQRPQVAGEAPTVSVGGVSSPEDAGHLDFAVTLDKASAQTATVVFGTTDGTAVAGIDYADTTGTLTFAPGTTSRTVAVRIEDDDVDEENETFTLVLSDAVNANLPALSGTGLGTIRDDDTRGVTVAPEALSVTENGSATYTVALDSEPTDEVTVTVSVPANSELSVDKPSLTFTTGNWNTAQTMTVSADDDDDAVADDVVTIGHSASGGDYNNESASVEVTIVEDDTPTLSIADRRAAESDGTIGFSVTLSIESSEQVTVDYVTSNGTGAGAATAGEDYTARSATLHFPANSTTPQTISIPITDDSVDEEEETFTVTLSNASNAALAGGQETLEATGTIEDDDATPTAVRLSVDPEKMSEGAGATDVAVTATLEGDSRLPGDTDVAVTVSDGTAGSADYTATEAMVRIPAGEQSGTGTVRLTPVDDTLDEDDETVVVNGSAGTLTVSSATLTIEDDDATPGLSIGEDVSVAEGGTATFTVTLGAAIGREVTVDWATSDGTATAGEDYAAVTDGRITFSPGGALSQTIGVTVSDDQVDEANETFTVALSNAVNAQVETGKESATGTIEDDDERGVTVAPEALSVTENSSATYTVALDSEPTAEVTVGVAVPPNSELSVDKTTLRFTADNWNTAQQIEVSAADDDDAVADAAATVGHSASGGDYNGQTAEVEVTIVEDDTPTLSIADRSAAESDGTMAFAVTLSVASSNEVTVAYATSNGTGPEAATAGEDYTEANGTLAFPANSTAPQTISVSIANDAVDEAVETFAVTLSNVQQASLAGGGSTLSAAGTITDDDERGVTVTPTALTVDEGGSGTYAVVLTSQPTADVTVDVTVPQGTDVSVDKTSLTFTSDDWETAQTVTVGAAGDDDAVVDDAVTITHAVSSTGDYAGETAADVEVRIAESDTPTLSIADESVAEDAVSATFTVTLSVASSNEVTVKYATSNGTGPEAATAGEDYTEADGTLTFPANSAAPQTIRVPITDDDLDEADEETFTLTLHSAAHADLAGGGTTLAAAGTITDDDDPPAAGIADAGASEGDGGITFTVSLETASARVVTVDWATAADAAAVNPATADADYTAANGTLSFPAQSTERTIRVLLVDDDAVEESETFKVELSNARYATLQASAAAAVGTIADDDVAPPPGEDPPTPGEEPPTPGEDPPPPKEEPPVTRNPEVIVFFGAADYEAAEGGSAAVTVRLSADPERRVTIPLTRTHLEGAADSDYSGVPANVAFAAGETSQEFAVTAVDDAVDDDGEAVVLGFGALPSGVAAGEPAAAAVALADDDVRGVTVRPEALNVPEGGSGSYTVVLDTEPTAEVTVLVAAPSASELSLDETSLTFAPAIWSRPQTVTVRAAEDADAMADDPVTLIHAVRGGDYEGVPAAPVEVKIIEDDAPTLAVAGGTAAEGEGAIEFAVTLSLASSSAVTVEYATSDVSAMAGADYQWTAGILTLPAGTTEAVIRVRVVDDDIDEADETFRVLLSNAVNAVVGDGEAAGEIADDDLPVVEIAADRAAVEEGGTAAFTLTRAGDLTGPLTVPVRVAERGVFLSDGVPSAATFAAGAATAALEAATTEDAVDEADGAVTAAILGAASHRVGASARAVVTVADNDVRGVRVSTTALTLPEGGAGTYTVTLETEPTGEVTIRMKMVSEDLTVTPPMLSFSPMTWDAPQTVTVRAAEDADAVLDPCGDLDPRGQRRRLRGRARVSRRGEDPRGRRPGPGRGRRGRRGRGRGDRVRRHPERGEQQRGDRGVCHRGGHGEGGRGLRAGHRDPDLPRRRHLGDDSRAGPRRRRRRGGRDLHGAVEPCRERGRGRRRGLR